MRFGYSESKAWNRRANVDKAHHEATKGTKKHKGSLLAARSEYILLCVLCGFVVNLLALHKLGRCRLR
jgi:hypothetical protein